MADEKRMSVTDVLKYAIQMEIDGKQYYQKAAESSINKLGREMYTWLAGQEEKHRIAFQSIYDSMKKEAGWPAVPFTSENRSGIRTLFAAAMKSAAQEEKGSSQQIDVIDKAKDLELQSRDFYDRQAGKAKDAAEKEFFRSLAAEEQGHYLTLVDYKEYLIDPAGYFLKTEHHSLDGG